MPDRSELVHKIDVAKLTPYETMPYAILFPHAFINVCFVVKDYDEHFDYIEIENGKPVRAYCGKWEDINA